MVLIQKLKTQMTMVEECGKNPTKVLRGGALEKRLAWVWPFRVELMIEF